MINQRGFSLVEIMLSLFLMMLVLDILFGHYLIAKRLYSKTMQQLEEEFELMQVEEFMRDRIKRAGFTPCLNLNLLENYDKSLAAIALGSRGESLSLSRMSDAYQQVIKLTPSVATLPANPSFKQGMRVLIADCYKVEAAEILFVKSLAGESNIHFKTPLHFSYLAPVYLAPWIKETFFVSKNVQQVKALYYKQDKAEELTALITQLSFALDQGLVQIKLTLADGKEKILESALRAA